MNPQIKTYSFRFLLILFLVFLIFVLIGFHFEEKINQYSFVVFNQLGINGIFAGVYTLDLLISPFPSDLFLFVVAKSQLATEWIWIVPFMGVFSSLGGITAAFLGRQISSFPGFFRHFHKMIEKYRSYFHKYGVWAIAISAITPLPFNIFCWIAGFTRLSMKSLILLSLLRIPRFLIIYALIEYSESFRALFKYF